MKGVLKQIREAETAVAREISDNAARGLYVSDSNPGDYAGGYRAALMDVEAAMRGHPNTASRYWPKTQGTQEHG